MQRIMAAPADSVMPFTNMPNLIAVTELDDTRIEAYRDIRERDLVGRDGLFVAEGRVVVEKLLASSAHQLLSLLIAAKRVRSLEPLLSGLPNDLLVFTAAQPVMDAIAGFPMHRGILAIGRRAENLLADALLGRIVGDGDVLLLSGIANHDNMGGIFRNAAAFGAKAVLLDPDCCDPLYRKAIRVSVGAALLVPFARLARGEDPLALLQRHGFATVALSPTGDDLLANWRPARRNAVLLGAEGSGLPAGLIARTKSVQIPMSAGCDSLNVATTSGIVLHHLSAARGG
jgi:tRNA G18 (ribose-2'-O)-methylase SpoU